MLAQCDCLKLFIVPYTRRAQGLQEDLKLGLGNSRHNDLVWIDVLVRVAFVNGLCKDLIVNFEEESTREFVQGEIAELLDFN